ncbi:MAG: hypothetical protein ACLP9L_33975 [Thermoguttaceae bacterium]
MTAPTSKIPWYRPTLRRGLVALLAFEMLLLLAERCHWLGLVKDSGGRELEVLTLFTGWSSGRKSLAKPRLVAVGSGPLVGLQPLNNTSADVLFNTKPSTRILRRPHLPFIIVLLPARWRKTI